MEIKVKYQGQEVGQIDFKVFAVIEKMRELGYGSFRVSSVVSKYESFASFVNEDNEAYIKFYPDRSFMKGHEFRVTSEELETIIEILNYYIYFRNVEESD